MFVLVGYDVNTLDVNGRRRLRNIAKACCDFGQRVQFSLFECTVTPTEMEKLRTKILKIMDMKEDSVRFYFVNEGDKGKIEHYGIKEPIDFEKPLIF